MIDMEMDAVDLGSVDAMTEDELYSLAVTLHDLGIAKVNAKSILLPMFRSHYIPVSERMTGLFLRWAW